MRAFICLAGLCFLMAGCNGNGADIAPPDEPKQDSTPIYEVVFRHELKGTKTGAGHYLSVDGKDPSPELMKRLQKDLPELQPLSKRPQDVKARVTGVGVDDLKWIDRDTAELMGGQSNGMDGHGSRFRVVRKRGVWTIDSVKVEFLS